MFYLFYLCKIFIIYLFYQIFYDSFASEFKECEKKVLVQIPIIQIQFNIYLFTNIFLKLRL